jgi:hypothetical protein
MLLHVDDNQRRQAYRSQHEGNEKAQPVIGLFQLGGGVAARQGITDIGDIGHALQADIGLPQPLRTGDHARLSGRQVC